MFCFCSLPCYSERQCSSKCGSIRFHPACLFFRFLFSHALHRCPRRNLNSLRDRLVLTLRQHSSPPASSSSSSSSSDSSSSPTSAAAAAAAASSSVTHPIGFYLFHLPPVYIDIERARSEVAAKANQARRAEPSGDEHERVLEEANQADAASTSAAAIAGATSADVSSSSSRHMMIVPSLFPADDVEQMPTRLEGAKSLQVCVRVTVCWTCCCLCSINISRISQFAVISL